MDLLVYSINRGQDEKGNGVLVQKIESKPILNEVFEIT